MNPIHLYSSSNDYSIKFWDMRNLSRTNTDNSDNSLARYDLSITPSAIIQNKKKMKISHMIYHSQQNLLAACQDKFINLYNVNNQGEFILSISAGHQGLLNGVCQLGNDFIASICSDQYIRVISLLNRKDINTPIAKFYQEESCPNNICTLGETIFITTGLDRCLRIWDIR